MTGWSRPARHSPARGLTTYSNAVHPLVQVYDAFMPTITAAGGTVLEAVPADVPLFDTSRRHIHGALP